MKKTLSFSGLHFTIAIVIAYVLTGNLTLGSLIAMLEPTVNAFAFYIHDRLWQKSQALQDLQRATQLKTASFAIIHFSVAFTVVYLITGDAFSSCFNRTEH